MSYRFKEARLLAGITPTELASRLGVSQGTVSNWDNEKKLPSLDTVKVLAELYNVSTDYLLGLDSQTDFDSKPESELISIQALRVFHGKPVWEKSRGWGLVNAIQEIIIFSTGDSIPFDQAGTLYTLPPAFTVGYHGVDPISYPNLSNSSKIWIEPISADEVLRNELKGWYTVHARYAENEFGQRFYFDSYGNKWLAFNMQF